MALFYDKTETTTVRISKEIHRKLKTLYPMAGYEHLEDFIYDGLVNWVKFVKEQLQTKKKE